MKTCRRNHTYSIELKTCPICRKASQKTWYISNREYAKTQSSNWKASNPKKVKEYFERNKESIHEANRIRSKKWRKANPKLVSYHKTSRRIAKLLRTPKWADLEAIKQFYLNCPKGFEVDHIIPLRGKTVSGLHIISNLQYLTKTENRIKSNNLTTQGSVK